MKKNIFNNGAFLIFVAAVLWAGDGFLRRSLYSLSPITIVFYEHLIGLFFLFPVLLRGFNKFPIKKNDWGLIGMISLLSGLLGTLWFTTALFKVNYISLSVVFLLQKLQPLFAISSSSILLKERLGKNYSFWAILAIISAYFVTFENGIVNFDTGAGTAIAGCYAVLAAFAWGTSTTLSKRMLNNYPDSYVTSLRFLLTTGFAFIALILMGGFQSLVQPNISQFVRFAIIALSTGMVALYIYYKGLKKVDVKVSTIIELTFPFLVIFADTFVYGTHLALTQYLAAGVLMWSMYKVGSLKN